MPDLQWYHYSKLLYIEVLIPTIVTRKLHTFTEKL